MSKLSDYEYKIITLRYKQGIKYPLLNQVRNLGNKSKEEVISALQEHGFSIARQPLNSPTMLKNVRMQKAIEIAICALQNHKTNDNKYEEYLFAINELKKIRIQ